MLNFNTKTQASLNNVNQLIDKINYKLNSETDNELRVELIALLNDAIAYRSSVLQIHNEICDLIIANSSEVAEHFQLSEQELITQIKSYIKPI